MNRTKLILTVSLIALIMVCIIPMSVMAPIPAQDKILNKDVLIIEYRVDDGNYLNVVENSVYDARADHITLRIRWTSMSSASEDIVGGPFNLISKVWVNDVNVYDGTTPYTTSLELNRADYVGADDSANIRIYVEATYFTGEFLEPVIIYNDVTLIILFYAPQISLIVPMLFVVVVIVLVGIGWSYNRRRAKKDTKQKFKVISQEEYQRKKDRMIDHVQKSKPESKEASGISKTIERTTVEKLILVICPYCSSKTEQGITKCQNCDAEL